MKSIFLISNELKSKYNSTSLVLQKIYDTATIFIDDISVQRFLNKCQEEYNTTEGEDCMVVNGRLFDWKEFESVDIIIEFLRLLNSYVSEETFVSIVERV